MLQKRGMCSGTDEMMFAEELGVKHRRSGIAAQVFLYICAFCR